MSFEKITEQDSYYHQLEKMSVPELLANINAEDKKIAGIVAGAIPQITILVEIIVQKMQAGGRLFYIGSGTSGRLGILDASECVPTYGIEPGSVIGIIAGGLKALTEPVEFAEDNPEQGWEDLCLYSINEKDIVIGIASSGTTPYVLGALKKCREKGIQTGSICCNPGSPISKLANFPVELVTGPEFVTGSTRMKAGTAQKMLLNMISTSVMIRLGRVEDNKMVNMQLSNEKLVNRAVNIIMDTLKISDSTLAKKMLFQNGSVKKVLENYKP